MKKAILILFSLVTSILLFLVYQIHHIALSPNLNKKSNNVDLFIYNDDSFENVLEKLSPYLIDKNSFIKLATHKKYNRNIRSGRFILKDGITNLELISILQHGNTPIRISFNNQERLENFAQRIANQLMIDSISLMEAFTEKSFLENNNLTTENALSICIPNTYEFYWNVSAIQFRNKILKEYHKFWNKNRLQKAKSINLSPLECIILASIIQKETTKDEEKARIAGVYLNRLKINMPLQADPTVIFAIKEQTQKFDTIIKRVLYKDLETESVYNTYKNLGLPPAPISMPDISSIEAVLNAEKHDFLYFVADTQKLGYHKFSKTLYEHNQYKNEYIKWVKSLKNSRQIIKKIN